ncbi:MAG: GEVED domain-containing protein [Rhodothermus sp.]|nr:GEVED domain-containing protein [Rhodothermus sp.]
MNARLLKRAPSSIKVENDGGILEITGTLEIDGQFVNDGTVEIDIMGQAPDSIDQLVVKEAILDDTLKVSFPTSFRPQLGDTFEVLIASDGIQGRFQVHEGLDLGGGLVLVPVYSANSLVLVLPLPRDVVNSTGDRSDQNPGDGECNTGGVIYRNGNPEAECTLRAAIEEANASSGPDFIAFDIPTSDPGYANGVWTIRPGSQLPEITEQVTIDGYTQPGAQPNTIAASDTSKESLNAAIKIELDGTNASPGLVLKNHQGSVIRGLVINRFRGEGILIDGGGGHRIVGNYIGTNPTGQTRAPNHGDGIRITASSGNYIGGPNAADRNLISGNGIANRGGGVRIENSSTNNVVEHNLIGTDASGTQSLYNSRYGVSLSGNGTVENIIVNNLISGNLDPDFSSTSCAGAGVDISNGAAGNGVQKNYIGTDTRGVQPLPNSEGLCISLAGAANWIMENIISGNLGRGIWISGQLNAESRATVIDTNLIGVARTVDLLAKRLDPLSNGDHGIQINSGDQSEIRRNIIGTNGGDGIRGEAQVSEVVIKGNEIVSNGGWGVYLKNFRKVTIQANGIGELKPANNNWRGGGGVIIGPPTPINLTWQQRISNKLGALKLEGTQKATVGGAYYAKEGNNLMSALPGVNAVEVVAQADSNRFENNAIDGFNTSEAGIYVENSSHNDFLKNLVFDFTEAGIAIVETDTTKQARSNRISQTVFDGFCQFIPIGWCNAIDLEYDSGPPINDDNDVDRGANKLQNTPENLAAYIDWNGDLVLLYRVDSDSNHATYPLSVEVFTAEKLLGAALDPTSRFLTTLTYPQASARTDVRVTLGKAANLGVLKGDWLALTATDAEGNTSEFEIVEVDSVSVDVTTGLDFGDAPETSPSQLPIPFGYPTTLKNDGARHAGIFNVRLGRWIDLEADGRESLVADGDDFDDPRDDDDGILFHVPVLLPQGAPPTLWTQPLPIFYAGYPVEISTLNSVGGYLHVWVDFNRDGDWDDAGEYVVRDQFVSTGVPLARVKFTVPADASLSYTFMRVRFTTVGGSITAPTGIAFDGEVEDYMVEIRAVPQQPFIDFGDAPDSAAASGYPTLLANQRYPAAGHIIGNLWLGDLIDPEWDGQPDSLAQGDGNDEDGVQLPGSVTPGQWATVTVTVSGSQGYLNAWVDFNQDHDWADSLEHVIVDTLLSSGTHQLQFHVPDSAALGRTYARFRISSEDSLSFWGIAGDGEVEDYVLEIARATATQPVQRPQSFRLEPPYPNPATRQITIAYALAEPSSVRLVIYNVLGQTLWVFRDRQQRAGVHRVVVPVHELPSGLYLVRLEAGRLRAQRTFVVLR